MKVLIISHPRSGSSSFARALAGLLQLESLEEFFTDNPNKTFNDLIDKENYVLKLQTHNFYNTLNFDDIKFSEFDYVFVTERKNKVDGLCSYALAQNKKKWQNIENVEPFKVTLIQLIDWIKIIKKFNEIVEKIKVLNIPYKHVWYEDIAAGDVVEYTASLIKHNKIEDVVLYKKSNIDYSNSCLNYSEIENKMKKYEQRIQR